MKLMKAKLELGLIDLKNSPDHNVVLAQSHFIKTVEDVHEMMVNCVPGAKFGLAFCEASGPRLVRKSGTDAALVNEAVRMAKLIGSGHLLVVVMKDMYPINILPNLKQLPEIVRVFAATANPLQVVVGQSGQGRGVLGVIDGESPLGLETDKDAEERRAFLRKIGYKQ
jgi:hypothetical protein